MAIEITSQTSTTSTRTTGPLNTLDQFTMTILAPGRVEGQETLRVPGVIVQGGDPNFVEGYGWGRDCYFDDVDKLVWPDGTECHAARGEDFHLLRSVKYRDITASELMELIQDVATDETSGCSMATRLGMIVGYIVACTEQFHDLNCPDCGKSPGLCNRNH